MSDLEHQPKTDRSELSFEGTDTRHVLVDGQPMDVDEKTYVMYKDAGALVEEIPHSGPHGEKPVNTFDNTSLPRAVREGILTSDSVRVTSTPPAHDTLPKKQRLTKKQKIGLFAATGVLGTVVSGGLYAATRGSDTNTEPRSEPSVSAPANPGETHEANSQTPSFGLEAAEYSNNPEMLAAAYYDQVNDFMIAGIDEAAANDGRMYDIGISAYIDEVCAPINKAFTDAMFAPGWENNPTLASFVENQLTVAHGVRNVRIRTFGQLDDEPFAQTLTPDSTSVESTDPLITSTQWTETNNADKNHAAEFLTPESLATQTGMDVFTWGEFDGQMKITDVSGPQ